MGGFSEVNGGREEVERRGSGGKKGEREEEDEEEQASWAFLHLFSPPLFGRSFLLPICVGLHTHLSSLSGRKEGR